VHEESISGQTDRYNSSVLVLCIEMEDLDGGAGKKQGGSPTVTDADAHQELQAPVVTSV
jgi:hypothetical protein